MADREIEAVLEFPAAPTSAGAARRFLRDRLDGWQVQVADHDVVLMLSELVTNVGLHARTEARVRLSFLGDRLRVEVTDGTTTPVQLRARVAGAAAGRGLMIVDALAAAWGVEIGEESKTVWFEVPAMQVDHADAGGRDDVGALEID